jgi:pre-mRNA-splicing helicase BRR2
LQVLYTRLFYFALLLTSYFLPIIIPQTTIGSKALLGNQASSVLRDAAEEVITILKDGSLRDPERHDQISRLLTGKPAAKRAGKGAGFTSEQYANFVQLGKQMDDYDDKKKGPEERGDKVDDEMGVAVVFDESDGENDGEEGGSDIEDGVVVDASSESEAEEEAAAVDESENEEEEKLVQGDGSKKKSTHAQERILSVHEIDAHFLQRQLSRHFDDADVSAKLARDVLEVLDIRHPTDVRECENKLLLLLRFDLFETIKLLLHNRVKVWACVSMKRAQSDEERTAIEEALMNDVTGEGKRVWDEIHSKSRAEDWSRERMRGLTDTLKGDKDAKDVSKALDSITVKGEQKGEGDDKMDVDDIKQEDQLQELDLEQLTFRDGAHTMSNKKCDLPDTSWRAMKKGYEEVHVPAIRSVIPKDEKLIQVSELPAWTHSCFKGTFKRILVTTPVLLDRFLTFFICS